MRLRTFSSIGGLRLFGNVLSPRDQGFNSMQDFLEVRVHKDDLSDIAIGCIDQVNTDASPELIAKCREVIEFVDAEASQAAQPDRREFIKSCEDNAGEFMRDGETEDAYYARLQADYGRSD